MATNRQDVLNELMKMKEQMDSLYAASLSCENGAGAVREPDAVGSTSCAAWQPGLDILESDDEWLALLDLPGVAEAGLSVELEGAHLTVTGERQRPPTLGGFRTLHSDRPMGCFRRQIDLPASVSEDRVEARLQNGVLAIRLIKDSLPRSTRRITIRAA